MSVKLPEDNNADKPQKPEKNISGEETSYFELSNILSWVTDLFKSKIPFIKKFPLKNKKIRRHISKRKIEELAENARKSLDSLCQIKEELRSKYGNASLSFIGKTIEPIIQSTIKFIEDLSIKPEQNSPQPTLLEQAINSVEQYLHYANEEQLKKKIISETISATRHAIETDCQILLHTFEDSAIMLNDRELACKSFAERLKPIFDELHEIAVPEKEIHDLHSLFVWKNGVDKKREVLSEIGFLTIDSLIPTEAYIDNMQSKESYYEKNEPVSTEYEITHLPQLAFLSVLEERSSKLYDLLENNALFNSAAFYEISNILEEIKNNTNGVVPAPEISNAFKSVQDSISKTEELLKKKQEQLSKHKSHHKSS